jgi:maleylpyruvate isomerase
MVMAAELTGQIQHVRDATRRLLAGLSGLGDAGVARPSLCPGWTAGHVLTHLARNADGLRRVAAGAERGEVLSPYKTGTRDQDIEAGAARPAAELAVDVAESAHRLDETWQALDAAAWDRPLLHHRLGRIPLRATPAMRWREIEVHRADLAGEYGPADWPAQFVAYLLGKMAGSAAGRLPPGAALAMHATDTGDRWADGAADGQPVTVSGPSWALAAWLMGRAEAARGALSATSGELPVLGPWG